MHRSFETAKLVTIFGLNEEQMTRREKVGGYIHSFGSLIAERLYLHYLLKDPIYHNLLSATDVPRLVRMFSEYLSSLFIHPFDDRMVERTRQIAQIHIAMGLELIHISRGFNILNEIVIDLSNVNTKIRDDLPIILKMLRISESIMNESYFSRLAGYQEDMKKENEILNLFDKLFASLMIHKQSQKKVTTYWAEKESVPRPQQEVIGMFNDETGCPLHTLIGELSTKKELLESLGVDLEEIKSLHHDYHDALDRLLAKNGEDGELYSHIETVSSKLYAVIDKPLCDISTTAFLGVHSGIEFLQSCTQSLDNGNSMGEPPDTPQSVQERLYVQLTKALGWCIDELYVGPKEISSSTMDDVVVQIILKNKRLNVGVKIKDIPNKIYMTEIIKILLEILKQNFHNREREHALIQLVDQVERASRSKDMFLANMSHELRTPLNAIIGFSQILMMNKSLPENLLPYIQKIGIAGNNLLTLVNTILDFAKLEAGKLNFKPEVTLIAAMMHDVVTIIEPMAGKKSITLEYPQLISLGLYLDRQLIQQVMLNLLSNAIKFTHEGGRVTIALDFDEEKRLYRFGVCDSGIGIEPKEIATLFNPFTQVENPFQKTAKGTGLGLAISKKIVEDLHGGKLWVESEVGVGSCFYFTIPVSNTQNTLERYVAQSDAGKRVLIVEDAPEYQKVLVDRLSSEFHLVVTNSVNKAKELLEAERFDFIILDFFLVDGISSEVLHFMDQNAISIPVIIISAEDDSKLIAHLPDTESVEGIFNKTHISEICDYLTKRIEIGAESGKRD
ncbi:MAG: ATP-binding protein [Sulfuricurvum sp.]|jgi:signal transduction histidine kinase/CheY-like chemotaxis protein|uniref:ATP-binding protein n=1 Tax=Sulfuricurvum sp. TaxID=2025608 RepID=UPI0025FBB040|nr:ATP-binding protein [Sulfuricurvum sp.]MCK9372207.1 ATP-binding protein [Sulfuricurvum sp.]